VSPDEINAKLAESMGWKPAPWRDGMQWYPSARSCWPRDFSPATDANDLLRVLCFHKQYLQVCWKARDPHTHVRIGVNRIEPHDGTPESITLAAATALLRALARG
jgi:hypothetical protein